MSDKRIEIDILGEVGNREVTVKFQTVQDFGRLLMALDNCIDFYKDKGWDKYPNLKDDYERFVSLQKAIKEEW